MTNAHKYRVIVSGNVLPEKSRLEVVNALALLFNSRRETMEQLLQGRAVPLRKEYEREPAEQICRAIHDAGAECYMEEVSVADADVSLDTDRQALPEDEYEAEAEDEPQHPHDDDAAQSAPPPPETKAIIRFVAVNTDYYLRQFAKFGGVKRATFALTWHWPAFLIFFFWAAYRKLWRWMVVHLAGSLILVFTVEPGVIYLAWAVFWPLTANYIYCRHVRSRVFGPRGELRHHEDEHDGDPSHAAPIIGGGVSRVAVGFGLILMFILSVILNNTLPERMLQSYTEQSGDLLPGPGSRERGDGSSIDDSAALSPKGAQTVASLNLIAGALKLIASRGGLNDSSMALSVFERFIEQRQVKDAWGTVIAVRQDAAGQVALVSAGPDRQFDSGDDIRQYIRFDDL